MQMFWMNTVPGARTVVVRSTLAALITVGSAKTATSNPLKASEPAIFTDTVGGDLDVPVKISPDAAHPNVGPVL